MITMNSTTGTDRMEVIGIQNFIPKKTVIQTAQRRPRAHASETTIYPRWNHFGPVALDDQSFAHLIIVISAAIPS